MKRIIATILLLSLVTIVLPNTQQASAYVSPYGGVTIVHAYNTNPNYGSENSSANPNYIDGGYAPNFEFSYNNYNNGGQILQGEVYLDGSYYANLSDPISIYDHYTMYMAGYGIGSHTTYLRLYIDLNGIQSWITSNTQAFYLTNAPAVPTCNVSVTHSVNGGASFASSTYNYSLNGPTSPATVSGDYTYPGLPVGTYTVYPSDSVEAVYAGQSYGANGSANTTYCPASTTAPLPIQYKTTPKLELH